jgi:hypothetical protein
MGDVHGWGEMEMGGVMIDVGGHTRKEMVINVSVSSLCRQICYHCVTCRPSSRPDLLMRKRLLGVA